MLSCDIEKRQLDRRQSRRRLTWLNSDANLRDLLVGPRQRGGTLGKLAQGEIPQKRRAGWALELSVSMS